MLLATRLVTSGGIVHSHPGLRDEAEAADREDPDRDAESPPEEEEFLFHTPDTEAVDVEVMADTTRVMQTILGVSLPLNPSSPPINNFLRNPSCIPLRRVSLTTSKDMNQPIMRETSKEEGT